MRKSYLILILLCSTAFTFAQTINYGIKAGLNLSNQYIDNGYSAGDGKNVIGFNAGVIVAIDFSKFFIEPGLFYTTKGEKFVIIVPSANPKTPIVYNGSKRLNYIELPVNVLYKLKLLPGGDIHLGGGPYIGYGVSENGSVNGESISGPFNKFAHNPDYGVNFIVGAKLMNKFIVDINYGLGLANLSGEGETQENRVLSFSVGYLFR